MLRIFFLLFFFFGVFIDQTKRSKWQPVKVSLLTAAPSPSHPLPTTAPPHTHLCQGPKNIYTPKINFV